MTEPIPIDEAVEHFMTQTTKSSVAVVVPLYGYWNDVIDNPVNGEVLELVLQRIYSKVHHLYIIFVANPQSLPNDFGDSKSVANIIISKSQGGNVKNIPVSRDATYTEYVREGMEFALSATNAQFVVVINPWVMIQEGGLDALIERVNRAGDAKIVSGTNIRTLLQPGQEGEFDRYHVASPMERQETDFNFLGIARYAAEMITFDPAYKTKDFLEVDIFQSMRAKGFAVISSDQIPIFPFDFPWSDSVDRAMFEEDRAHFIKKWTFDCGLEYPYGEK
jgi:hypothetical protein